MTASRQSQFHAAILDPAQPAPDGLTDGQGRAAGRRFSVYRNNVAVSLTEALEQTFPVILKLLGEENFRAVAGIYLRAHPPVSPILSSYGESFPAFLEGFEPLSHLGYLPDTARLERALVRAYHAADAAPVSPTLLPETPPDDLAGLHLAFAPAVQLLRSPWPVHAIWRFNTEAGAPQPPATAQDVLITRPGYDPLPRLLPPGGAAMIKSLASGAPLGDALDAALAEAPEFEPAPLLTLLLDDNALAGKPEDRP